MTYEHKIPPCMGGWCERREKCRRYQVGAPMNRLVPAERLCPKGETPEFIPVTRVPWQLMVEEVA